MKNRYRKAIKISVSKTQADWFNSLTSIEKFAVLCIGETFMSSGGFVPEDILNDEDEQSIGGHTLYVNIGLQSENKLSLKFVQLLLSGNRTLADVHIAKILQHYFALEFERQEKRFDVEMAEHFTLEERGVHHSDYPHADTESLPVTGAEITSRVVSSVESQASSQAFPAYNAEKDLNKPPKPPKAKIHFNHEEHEGQNHEGYKNHKVSQQEEPVHQEHQEVPSKPVPQEDSNTSHNASEDHALKYNEISPVIRELQGMFD